jgi:hypothetical protein
VSTFLVPMGRTGTIEEVAAMVCSFIILITDTLQTRRKEKDLISLLVLQNV